MVKISQSFIKDAAEETVCPKYMYFKYVKGFETVPSVNMLYGLYFEYHLLGGCRGGQEPKIPLLKGGIKPKAFEDVDIIIAQARIIMERMGVKIKEGRVQLELETKGEIAHLDLEADDFERPGRLAIYDVKFTETKITDRWFGWGDVENDPNVRIQPRHYVRAHHDAEGKQYYPPFYYFVFGKSGWVRVIKVIVTPEGMEAHKAMTEFARRKGEQWEAGGWQARPEFNKCQDCQFNAICTHKATIPRVEIIEA